MFLILKLAEQFDFVLQYLIIKMEIFGVVRNS